LFGKSLKYLEQSMQEFKYDQRAATVMQRIAKGYTLEEIRLISEYFASLYIEMSVK
jgi:sulfide dehydrogenase cytochrome subunit